MEFSQKYYDNNDFKQAQILAVSVRQQVEELMSAQ